MFFVLSAFLITSILLKDLDRGGSIDLKGFWGRRARRLAPALMLYLASYAVAAPALFPGLSPAQHARDAAVTALYLSDYGYAFFGVPDVLRHSWSLAAEAHFYLLWPFVLPALARCGRPLAVLSALWVAATAWRGIGLELSGWDATYYRFDTRLSGFFAGAALAFVLRKPGRFRVGPAAIWASLGVLVLLFGTAGFGHSPSLVWGGAAAELASAALIGAAALGLLPSPLDRLLASAPAAQVGKLSYGVYLWHFPIALLVRERMDLLPAIAVTASASLSLAAISYGTVEAAFRRPKRRAGSQAMYTGSSAPTV